ncbi:TonB-dependent receptor [Formicincola oecophyllae]|uniref:TonB-dependent receptor n=1 Tax=Formicincola oecophyllae TaxID=2558361 RepID=A0A4Y6U9Z1_9PROT|nr:TonB-dependent receptor [Formicincola oecophyllae]QDH13398.1 TonB-dependent receptor [Formicincola oecophyllae]
MTSSGRTMPPSILKPIKRMLLLGCCWTAVLAGSVQAAPSQGVEVKKVHAPVPAPNAAAAKPETIQIRASRRERVEVSMGGQVGVLGRKKGLDVPFSLHSYNASLITNQQSQTLAQVLENDPSVRTTQGGGNFADMFMIRGLPVVNDDVAIGGLYGIAPRELVSPQIFDSVQVLNGPTAFLNGMAPAGSVGGTIDLEYKHAGNKPFLRLTGDYTSGAMGGGNIDMGRRFGDDKQLGMRLNVAGMDGQTAIDHERRRNTVLGFDTDWRSSDGATRASLNMDYENQEIDWGRPQAIISLDGKGRAATSVPHPVKPAHNYGQRWSYMNMAYMFGMASLEHDFNDHVTVYGKFGGMNGDESGQYGTFSVLNGATGAGTVNSMYVPFTSNNQSTVVGTRVRFDTPFIHHEVNAGGQGLWETQYTAYSMALGNNPRNNLYHTAQTARPAANFTGGNTNNPGLNNTERLFSLFFSDTMKFWHNRFELTGGFRYQNVQQRNYNYGTSADKAVSGERITPIVTLVYHATKQASFYFNRVQGLSPGLVAPVTYNNMQVTNHGKVFNPYETTQYEIGGKYQWRGLSASLAFFQLSQANSLVRAAAYDHAGVPAAYTYTMDGMQRNRGIEFALNGTIVKGLRFNGGTTILQAKQVHSQYNTGRLAFGIPGYMINGHLEWDIPWVKGLTVMGQVNRTGHEWADNANTAKVHGWTTADIGARYTFVAAKRPFTARFGIDNINNAGYWSVNPKFAGYLTEGAPRTFKFSISCDL